MTCILGDSLLNNAPIDGSSTVAQAHRQTTLAAEPPSRCRPRPKRLIKLKQELDTWEGMSRSTKFAETP